MASGNVFLIGPMGVGKSTIGRHLAKLLKLDFVDADSELEQRTGASISLIFEIEGEEGFRRRESALLRELTANDQIVLATGGGAVLSEANRRLLRRRGTVVYLRASIDTQLKRTRRSKDRPLLAGADDRRSVIESLMEHREPLYEQEADIAVNTDNRSPAAVAKEIARRLEEK